jgi:hypothetical protein
VKVVLLTGALLAGFLITWSTSLRPAVIRGTAAGTDDHEVEWTVAVPGLAVGAADGSQPRTDPAERDRPAQRHTR